MSTRYSLAQRTPLHNSLAAGIACAVTLALFAGSAMAAPADLERVEVNGRMVQAQPRHDVRAACQAIDEQLQDALQTTWERERRVGQVKVQIVMDGGDITAVQANGISNSVERSVRHAVNGLRCGVQAATGPQVYRFRVDFIDPADTHQRMAGASRGYRLAMLTD